MGIHKLMDLLREKAPNSIRHLDLSFFQGRIVACDASMVEKLNIKGNVPIFDNNIKCG